MNRWIKCGLPWTFYGDWKNSPQPPNLKKEEKKKFGQSTEQAYKEFEILLKDVKGLGEEYQKVTKSKEYKSAQKKYKKFADEVHEWIKTHPRWLEYQQKSQDYDIAQKKLSFCGRGLNKPGTLIEVSINNVLKQLLIGDINTAGGVCDDCMGFEQNTIVVRYKTNGHNQSG